MRNPLVNRNHCFPDHLYRLVWFILTELYRTPEELFPRPSQPTGIIHSYRVLQNSRGTLLYTEVTVPLTIPTDWYDSFLPSFTELQRNPLVHRSHCSPDHLNRLVTIHSSPWRSHTGRNKILQADSKPGILPGLSHSCSALEPGVG